MVLSKPQAGTLLLFIDYVFCLSAEVVLSPCGGRCVFFYMVVCWGSRVMVTDTNRLNKLIRKAGSVLGVELVTLVKVSERRVLTEPLSIMGNLSHPIHLLYLWLLDCITPPFSVCGTFRNTYKLYTCSTILLYHLICLYQKDGLSVIFWHSMITFLICWLHYYYNILTCKIQYIF